MRNIICRLKGHVLPPMQLCMTNCTVEQMNTPLLISNAETRCLRCGKDAYAEAMEKKP